MCYIRMCYIASHNFYENERVESPEQEKARENSCYYFSYNLSINFFRPIDKIK